jgi:hypothetical protein
MSWIDWTLVRTAAGTGFTRGVSIGGRVCLERLRRGGRIVAPQGPYLLFTHHGLYAFVQPKELAGVHDDLMAASFPQTLS